MLKPNEIHTIPLQQSEGRAVRLVLDTRDLQANDPFVILADDTFAHNTFADHPHKGIQTVTYVLDGSLTHYDSKTGTGGRLSEGDFQIMTAGRGIIHNENPDHGEEARVMQLWVNLSSEHKKVDGQYEDLAFKDVPTAKIEGGLLEVYAGKVGELISPLKQFTPFTFAVVTLQAGASYHLPVQADFSNNVYVLEGDIKISGENASKFQAATFAVNDEATTISFEAKTPAKIAYFGGQPIRQPIAARGPFVMNTNEELKEAFADYRNGQFLDGAPY